MCFAMISAGVFDNLAQVYPIVLGAHIGTCITALLGSIGTHIEAKRCAYAHLLFNVLNVALAAALSPWLLQIIESSSTDLVHQTANLHTAVMVVSALLILPFTTAYVWLVRVLSPTNKPMPETTYLDSKLLDRPETAILRCDTRVAACDQAVCSKFTQQRGSHTVAPQPIDAQNSKGQ